jgi:hypothetical protein
MLPLADRAVLAALAIFFRLVALRTDNLLSPRHHVPLAKLYLTAAPPASLRCAHFAKPLHNTPSNPLPPSHIYYCDNPTRQFLDCEDHSRTPTAL